MSASAICRQVTLQRRETRSVHHPLVVSKNPCLRILTVSKLHTGAPRQLFDSPLLTRGPWLLVLPSSDDASTPREVIVSFPKETPLLGGINS
jgi:hypothetical protein